MIKLARTLLCFCVLPVFGFAIPIALQASEKTSAPVQSPPRWLQETDRESEGIWGWQIAVAGLYLLVLGGLASGVVIMARRGRLKFPGMKLDDDRLRIVAAKRVGALTLYLLDIEGQRVVVAVSGSSVAIHLLAAPLGKRQE